MSEQHAGRLLAQFPLKAQLSAMNERTQALLRYHFDHDQQHLFTLCASTAQADVQIVDYDHPGTREAIDAGRWDDAATLLVLAYGNPPIDNAVVLRKPLDRTRLDAAAHQLLHEHRQPARNIAPRSQEPAERKPEPAPQRPAQALPDEHALDDETVRYEAKLHRLCGRPRNLAELTPGDDADHRYDPRQYVIDDMNRALHAANAPASTVQLSLSDMNVYIMPCLNRVYMTESLQRATNVERLFRPLDRGMVDVRHFESTQTSELLDRLATRARYAYSIPAFRWLAALFVSQGRLPMGFDIHEPILLKQWPNLTRLELTPECMAIAAAWTQRARSLADIVTTLACEPRYVCAFHNGAHALNLFSNPAKSA